VESVEEDWAGRGWVSERARGVLRDVRVLFSLSLMIALLN